MPPTMPLIRFPGRCSLCSCIVILVTTEFSSKSNLYTPSKTTSGDKLPCGTAGFCIHVQNKAWIWKVNAKVTLTLAYIDAILWFQLHAFLTVNVHTVHILQQWGKCYSKLYVYTAFFKVSLWRANSEKLSLLCTWISLTLVSRTSTSLPLYWF